MDLLILRVTSRFFSATIVFLVLFPGLAKAQPMRTDSLLQNATLENVVHYAIQRNPDIKNASLNEEITETIIKSKLSEWYPQVNFNYSLQHTFQLPTANFNG